MGTILGQTLLAELLVAEPEGKTKNTPSTLCRF
jgi:hypothetical protein